MPLTPERLMASWGVCVLRSTLQDQLRELSVNNAQYARGAHAHARTASRVKSCLQAHPVGRREGRRMGCLLALLAGVAPRVALVLVWIFTNWVDRAFNGFLIPLLGLIVFPYATLFYVLAYNPVTGGLAGWGWIFVVLGFVFDIGHWVGGGVTGRQRYASA